jgi:FtsZ-interacting cell division protein ZipA
MPTWLIWVIVIVVVLLIIAALVAMSGRRRTAQRREQAQQLRQEATTQASALPESQRQADELRAKADLARAEAERAEGQAAEAQQSHRIEQAGYEDKLREADRLDPEVDHKSGDYEPDVWNDQRTEDPDADPVVDSATTESPREGSPTETPTHRRSEG